MIIFSIWMNNDELNQVRWKGANRNHRLFKLLDCFCKWAQIFIKTMCNLAWMMQPLYVRSCVITHSWVKLVLVHQLFFSLYLCKISYLFICCHSFSMLIKLLCLSTFVTCVQFLLNLGAFDTLLIYRGIKQCSVFYKKTFLIEVVKKIKILT